MGPLSGVFASYYEYGVHIFPSPEKGSSGDCGFLHFFLCNKIINFGELLLQRTIVYDNGMEG